MSPIIPDPPRPPERPKGLISGVKYPFEYGCYIIKLLKWNSKK